MKHLSIFTLVCLCCTFSLRAEVATGVDGIAVSVNPIATQAAIDTMKKGGNAIDAAVAAALTLGVVDGHNSGIGGGCFILIRHANGSFNCIDGRETAPAKATRDMFLRNGKADPELSQTGALAVATPGALAAYNMAIERWGKRPLKEHLLAASKIADDGFPVDKHYAEVLQSSAADLKKFESSRGALLKANGEPYKAGEVMKQPDLARSYRAMATNGIGWFYGGPFARATEDWMKKNGGLLTSDDLKNYSPQRRDPIFSNYRGAYTIASFPPPSSGGVHVVEILKILENKNLAEVGVDGGNAVHLIAEAMKLAFADRAYWLGDPDFVKVPKGLVTKKYAASLAAKIDMEKASKVEGHGTPDNADKDVFEQLMKKHTTHLCTADAEGNWVSCTMTVNTSFGSKVVIPGTGIVMNNEMDDFSAQPGAPNFFGLVGAEANAVAPGKRPLSSMSPTILLKDGQPILAVGAAGGPTIISQVLLTIVNTLDFKMPLDVALKTPRFHQQWSPDELRIEASDVPTNSMHPSIIETLEKKGHKLNKVKSIGACQAIAKNPEAPGFIGCADPRGFGKALGYTRETPKSAPENKQPASGAK
ncbi:MAG: gamma-glutamyltransferase 1 [Verrucomicrobiales bacterium]|nr:gamma-glutamyltransferase 1 [Verrucomicrobiales bacterium]